MSASRDWDRIAELFERLREFLPEERQSFLDKLAQNDPQLAATLSRMLAAEDGKPGILDRGSEVAEALLDPDPSDRPPERIGPYRIIRLLGEGGMGRVYLAELESVGGRVALKVLRDAWVSPQRRTLFAAEQRALAQLNHPGIAQLHQVGVLGDGTPWFAMEYVEGTTITEYAQDQALPVADRLRLVAAVCRAVQHAHAHAIIHRDIKPSNVMVRSDGTVVLLDFGIAKQLDDPVGSEITRTGMRMLTPAYAAPEQFTGGPIDVRSDIHAIGVLLYKLLTGRLPWDSAQERSTDPLSLRKGEVVRPSRFVGEPGAASGRADWHELDVLVMAAMHQDRERRYSSAEALARDIDHYLNSRPLEARPDTATYRFRRLLRRRWRETAVLAGLVVLVAALSGTYAVNLTRARDRALAEAARTQRIQAFMLGLFTGGDSAAGPADTLTVRALIHRGEREAASLNGEPAVRAELWQTLGQIQAQLGNFSQGDSLLRASLAERKRLFGDNNIEVARSQLALGQLRTRQARYPQADSLINAAVAYGETNLPVDHPLRISSLAALARLQEDQGKLDSASSNEERVLQLLGSKDTTNIEYADALVALASTAFYAGRLEQSDSLNRRALAIYRNHRNDNHPSVADVLINLGAIQFEHGEYDVAEQYDRQALQRIRSWYGEDNPETASALTLLGRALTFQKKSAEADTVLKESMRILVKTLGPNHPDVASASNTLGVLAFTAGRYDEAEHYFKRNAEIYRSIYGPRHWLIGIADANLGSVALNRGDNRTAEQYFREAISQATEGQGADHLNTAIAWVKLGRSLLRQQRYREAVDASRKGYDLLTKRESPPQGFVDAARKDLAAAYGKLGDNAQAEAFEVQP